MPYKPCSISNSLDFKVWNNLGANPQTNNVNNPNIDLSVVNVLNLTAWAQNSQGRSYRIVDVDASGSLNNAVFIVNVSIDLS